METRLDRIERGIEGLLQGIAEFRESQKKTDEQILELKESQKKTDEQILELKEFQKKTGELQRKTDEQLRKTDAQLNKTAVKLDRLGVLFGNLGIVQGEVAEDLFYRNVDNLFAPMDLRFERIRRNLKVKGYGEYDIVAENGGRVLVIEVKNKLEKRMVDSFMEDKLPRFKTLFPKYKDRRVLAGMGALVVKDDVGRYAEKAGLFVLTQAKDGGAALFNRKDFKPKEFA
jgi:hypothetical protein